MATLQTKTAVGAPPRRRPLFLLGGLLFLLGPVLYAVQIHYRQFFIPWYVPALATVGALLMAVSAWQRRGVVRTVGLVLFIVLCGLEWFYLAAATRTPAYTGPAQAGRKVPAFATTLAGGEPFTDRDLATGDPAVLVFFRGHW